MKIEPDSSYLRVPLFMVGQDEHGRWIVQDTNGLGGGLFVSRAEALRFVRAENGNRAHAFVAVNGVFDLDFKVVATAALSKSNMSSRLGQRRVA